MQKNAVRSIEFPLTRMKNTLSIALGSAVGTLLYTALLNNMHEPDWGRAMIVAIMCAILSVASSRMFSSR